MSTSPEGSRDAWTGATSPRETRSLQEPPPGSLVPDDAVAVPGVLLPPKRAATIAVPPRPPARSAPRTKKRRRLTPSGSRLLIASLSSRLHSKQPRASRPEGDLVGESAR